MTAPRKQVMGTWHPKVDVNAVSFDNEPLHGLAVGEATADVRKYVSDDMATLIRQQEMCHHCLQEFPCSMQSSERFSRWAEAMDRGQFRVAHMRSVALDRVLNRCCPMCGVPQSDVATQQQITQAAPRVGDA